MSRVNHIVLSRTHREFMAFIPELKAMYGEPRSVRYTGGILYYDGFVVRSVTGLIHVQRLSNIGTVFKVGTWQQIPTLDNILHEIEFKKSIQNYEEIPF